MIMVSRMASGRVFTLYSLSAKRDRGNEGMPGRWLGDGLDTSLFPLQPSIAASYSGALSAGETDLYGAS